MDAQGTFYIRRRTGVITGPFTAARLKAMKAAGRLGTDDLVSSDKVNWVRYGVEARQTPAAQKQPVPPVEPPPAQAPRQPSEPAEPWKGAHLRVQSAPQDSGPSSGRLHLPGIGLQKPEPPPATSPAPSVLEPEPQKPMDVDKILAKFSTPKAVPSRMTAEDLAVILGSIWDSPTYVEALQGISRFAALLVPYSLLAAVVPWVLFPPVEQMPAHPLLAGVFTGSVLWIIAVALCQLTPLAICVISNRRYLFDAPEKAGIYSAIAHKATLIGTLGCLHAFLRPDGLLNILPWLVTFGVWLWNEIMDFRMWRKYARLRGMGSDQAWIIGILLPSFLFLLLIVFVIYVFGGYR